MATAKPPDQLLHCFQSLSQCTPDIEKQALDRLASSTNNGSRAEIQFALSIVNQTNQQFSKKSSEIRKERETRGSTTTEPLLANIERMIRVAMSAFRLLYQNRRAAGFSALALEKTLSNFITACANAHLGLYAWDALVVLREWLLDYADTHTMAPASRAGSKDKPAARAVRKPVSARTRPGTTQAASRTAGRSGPSSTEGLAAGIHRLSISKQSLEDAAVAREIRKPPVSFPISFCQGDLAFNNLVVSLLCNCLRVLAQDCSLARVAELTHQLASRENSALEWCLRVQEMDGEAVGPFLSVCFRSYYALGAVVEEESLRIRLLGLIAYSKSKSCDTRELLKYATKAAKKAAEAVETTGAQSKQVFAQIDSFYTELLAQIRPAFKTASLSPELVEFCHHLSQTRRMAGRSDTAAAAAAVATSACRLILPAQSPENRASNVAAELVAGLLISDTHAHLLLESSTGAADIMLSATTTVAGISALLEATLDSNSRNTLAGWNALALCADTIRKTAKRILPKLRQSAINREIQDCTSSLLVSLLDAADRIYHAYVVRGAAAKAESTGGSKVSTLTNCNAEVCLNAIQLAIQYQEHSAQAHTIAMRLSDRLLTLCRESLCNRDFLRSHSTVFFNRGASLFQLKIYSQAAQAMQQAIDSLSLWITLANSDGQVTDTDTDTLGQLCKRFEIAASAYQANHSFDKASQQYAGAVLFVCTRFSQSLQDAIIVSKDIAIPPFSSTWNRGSVVDRALMFVDRYARMCANRILKDPEESSACVSLLQHFLDDSISGQVAGAWLLEAEAHFWRPFMAPSGSLSASSVLKTRLKHLESAVAIYEQQGCLLGHARCLLEMAKINRDLHAPNDCAAASDNLETALNICKAMPSASSNIYVLSVLVECYAWSSIIKIESGSPSGADISACTILSALVFNQIDGREKDLGVLRNMVDAQTLLLGLLMSRRMYSYSHDIQLVIFNIAMLCESSDSAWLPVGMESLVGLGMACMLQGKMQAAEGYFAYAASRYKSSVLPVHVQVASKIAYASFKLASGDMAAGVSVMEEAAKIARDALDLRVSMSLSARKKRQPVSPETLVLLSKASQAYSEIALKQGALADSIDFSVHSYRILSALLKSLSMAHKRNLQDRLPSSASSEDGDRMDVATDDDPFADNGTKGSSLASQAESSSANNSSAAAAAAGRSGQTSDGASDEDKSDAQFVAFSGNWELQRLLIENLAHLAKVYSIRGSVKEAEYFLKKGIEISMQLQAPHQEDFMRLLEADILSRKSLWDECAQALHSLRRRLPESEDASVATGKMEVVCALVNEGDSWRRSRQVDRARSSYSRALEMLGNMSIDEYDGYEEGPGDLAASVGDISQATPRLQRVLAQAGVSDKQAAVSSDCSTRMDGGGGNVAENLPLALSIMKDDIVARLRLLSLLHGTSDSSSSDSLDMVQAGGVMTAGRSMDKQPEHYLMRANLVFIELQRMLSEEPVWKSILQSALLFPAFQKARSQKPRKGTIKALIRDKLAELDGLLRAAAESAITVGSAHCVHESTHLLALVMSMSVTFGFAPIVGSCGRGIEAVIARVVDDSLNITAVRESVDARRRRGEAVPSELTVWPQDILCSKGPANGASDGYRGSRSRGWDDRDSMNTSPVPSLRLGGVKSLDAPPDWSPGALSLPKFGKVSPSKHASFSAVKAADNAADLAEEPFFEIAADGARVVSEWAIDSDASAGHPLSSTLPPSWVVCGISVDDSRNVLFVTRYERGCSPITLCLPMREVELSLEFAEQISVEGQCATSDDGNSSAFASAYQKISAIIAESDRTMKTGSSCSTDEEKRSWWEYRASLDRQLGLFLRGIENVWLGGFRHVLQPGSVLPGAGLSSGLHGKADRSLMVSSLRSEIQSCLSSCLPKAFASKAKTIELSEQLCMLVLGAAHRFLVADPQSSDERASCTGNDDKRSDWLDICSMLWDLYCYQGAAPSSEEAVLDSFAEKLLEVMQQFIGANDWVTSVDSNGASGSERPHLILALDKHAQQIPWECLPALRDYPISRVPSIAFLQQRMATMHARRSSHIPRGSSRSGSFSEGAGDLLSILKGANGGPCDSVTTPDTATDLAGLSVSGQHVFYVLNPEGDLHRTQTNFADYLEAQPEWRGVIGRRPMNLECERGLSSSDIFMYFGHGGAENYISRSQIRSLDKCAVALLFGCSSGRLKMTGEYDAMGTATDYMVGGCPALVGNLWDVGDKDIDRFAASMLQSWGLDRFSPGKIAVKVDGFSTFLDSKPQVKTCVSLAEAVCEARKACRMAYLTGAAPVVYGIPVYLLD